jgi:hypothetical protein
MYGQVGSGNYSAGHFNLMAQTENAVFIVALVNLKIEEILEITTIIQ